jgi:multidrug efflux pump subunit AcrB
MSALAVALVAPLLALAQDQGGRRRLSPEERQKQAMARLQERLGATPDEMQVLTPKIEKVMAAQREARGGGGFGMGGGRGGRGDGPGAGGTGNQPETAAGKAAAELRATLENKDAPAADVAARLAALREARAKARADLDAARKELVAVLTPRQEAVMVSAGLLE